jgi:hypothetical protein
MPVARAELPLFEVINLDDWWGPSTAADTYLLATALNDENEVLFTYNPGVTTYQLWKDGARLDPGPPSYAPGSFHAGATHFRSLSNQGSQSAGIYNEDTDELRIGVIQIKSGNVELLPHIPGAIMDGSVPAQSSNGQYLTAQSDDFERGWVYSYATDTWKELEGPGYYIQPDSVNNSGAAAGRMADADGRTVPFYTNAAGMVTTITDDGIAIYGHASAISNNGLVTGTANGRAFAFNSSTMELTWLTASITGWQGTDVNDRGEIIGATILGSASIHGGPSGSAFYWNSEVGSISLENLIGDELDNWFITSATDISNNGSILATGYFRQDGSVHQVLLRPIPEPTGAALILAGLVLSIAPRRRGPSA